MTKSIANEHKINKIIIRYSCICAGVATQPLPFADIFVITPIQALMGNAIAREYGIRLSHNDSKEIIKELMATIGLGFAGQQITIGFYKLIPFISSFGTIPIVYGLTYSMGTLMNKYFRAMEKGIKLNSQEIKQTWKDEETTRKKIEQYIDINEIQNEYRNFTKSNERTVVKEVIIKDKKDRENHEKNLEMIWGFPSFYDDQWNSIKRTLKGKRILLIESTGFGKSLCFQYPAKYFSDNGKGLTIVFSPLIALMRDQVKNLQKKGINAACINSGQSAEENTKILDLALNSQLDILYIAPERYDNEQWKKYIEQFKLAMVVIDEAHCISKWGSSFRPSYQKIFKTISLLPEACPVLGVTATAPDSVRRDIINQMGKDTEIISGKIFRENLNIEILSVRSINEKMSFILDYIRNQEGIGIIYTARRKDAELFSEWLKFNKVKSNHYHAGRQSKMRKSIEIGFMKDEWKVLVATKALGMGLDKPNIRFVIHTHIPGSIDDYYQEIGRAGRDKVESDTILLYDKEDIGLQRWFIDREKPSIEKYRDVLNFIKDQPKPTYNQVLKFLEYNKKDTRLIINDLIEQGKVYEDNLSNLKVINYDPLYEEFLKTFRKKKEADLKTIIEYANLRTCRMQFICQQLGDSVRFNCGKCDNDIDRNFQISISPTNQSLIDSFYEYITPFIDPKSGKINYNKIGKPKRSSNRWLDSEVQDLIKEYNLGISIKEIANKHERTPFAIIGRLSILGIISEEESMQIQQKILA